MGLVAVGPVAAYEIAIKSTMKNVVSRRSWCDVFIIE